MRFLSKLCVVCFALALMCACSGSFVNNTVVNTPEPLVGNVITATPSPSPSPTHTPAKDIELSLIAKAGDEQAAMLVANKLREAGLPTKLFLKTTDDYNVSLADKEYDIAYVSENPEGDIISFIERIKGEKVDVHLNELRVLTYEKAFFFPLSGISYSDYGAEGSGGCRYILFSRKGLTESVNLRSAMVYTLDKDNDKAAAYLVRFNAE